MTELLLIAILLLLLIAAAIFVVHTRRESRRYARQLQEQSKLQFQAMASQMLKAQAESLQADNSRQMDAVLKPLVQNLSEFRKTMTDCYVNENASRKSLTDQIDRLMRLNESIGAEARNLTSALKGNSKVQGDWGEMMLTTLLEQAGLEQGVNFDVQPTRDDSGHIFRDDEGRRLRPDVIIRLPQGRKLIIDSKVSLTAFVDSFSIDDEKLRQERLKEHLLSMRRHVDELANKKYQDKVDGSPDQVIMFVPNEGAYIAAVQQDPGLWQYAYSRHVAIVSPTHLFSMMQIVSQLWVQEKQNRHTQEIAKKGAALYDKVMLFMQSLEDVGTALDNARKNFDTAMSRLATGKGNVAKLSQDLADLGVKSSKSMPHLTRSILERDNDALSDKPRSIEKNAE